MAGDGEDGQVEHPQLAQMQHHFRRAASQEQADRGMIGRAVRQYAHEPRHLAIDLGPIGNGWPRQTGGEGDGWNVQQKICGASAGGMNDHRVANGSGGENVLELKMRAGIADAYEDSIKVPIYERYFLGGANTVRGYRERRLGPRDPGNNDPIGGEAYWVANVEETFPIYPDLIKGAVFFDAGSLVEEIEDFGDGEVFTGVGVGVRNKTPIGPVKLDMGYPLDDVEGEKKKARFYFSISRGF